MTLLIRYTSLSNYTLELIKIRTIFHHIKLRGGPPYRNLQNILILKLNEEIQESNKLIGIAIQILFSTISNMKLNLYPNEVCY